MISISFRRCTPAAALIGVFLLAPAISLAVFNGTEPDPTDTRFDAVAAFSITDWINGETFPHNTTGAATLIAPDMAITVRHLLENNEGPSNPPASGKYSLRFRRHFNGSLGSKAAGWQSFHQVKITHFTFHGDGAESGNPDLVIAHLEKPVKHIQPISIATYGTVSPGEPVIAASWGNEDPTRIPHDPDRGRLLLCDSVTQQPQPNNHRDYCSRIPYCALYYGVPGPGCDCGILNHDSGGGLLREIAGTDDGHGRPLVELICVVDGGIPQAHDFFGMPCIWPECARRARNESACHLRADFNGDFIVDEDDLTIALTMLGPCSGVQGDPCVELDFDRSGVIDQADIDALIAIFGTPASFCDCLEDIAPKGVGDGVIDGQDLAVLLAAWGSCDYCDGATCEEDINNDGEVDSADLAILMAAWGICDH